MIRRGTPYVLFDLWSLLVRLLGRHFGKLLELYLLTPILHPQTSIQSLQDGDPLLDRREIALPGYLEDAVLISHGPIIPQYPRLFPAEDIIRDCRKTQRMKSDKKTTS